MNDWERYLSVMEHDAIKTDDMATEDTYFMATHMPFPKLEVYRGGRTNSKPQMMDEDAVFDNLICNPDNEHRMIIVRGDNGTGKSHLIRFLKARLERSSSTVFNPDTEQLVFLRRLNNSVRGAFSQLIEQGCIANPEVEAKLRKFVSSSDSKDEASFKNDILYSYIAAVSSDTSGDFFKPRICPNIASYLSDSRVKEYLLREGGAISRCYQMITAPSNQVLQNTVVFTEEDFNVKKIIRAVHRQGDPDAQDFASDLAADMTQISRLVAYLNHFTRDVVQRCADISSESTKAVFEQLRRDLKQQGKNLTLFIEDFTGFTGIDSELITVLSTEHGGDYADLCRVTSVIGITNDYYDQFRDNFTDRVTHQISVTDASYGTDDFLVHMAGRYLNAIYCDPSDLREWSESGADVKNIPISDFKAPCIWETVQIEGKEATLYPFNSASLTRLYEDLPVKSPRMFLKEVIRSQLKDYFDGKLYPEEDSDFPQNPGARPMQKAQHGSAIDRLSQFSADNKTRLKSVFSLWGDGTADGIRKADGTITFGGIPQGFLDDIGLGQFIGIGDLKDESSGTVVSAPKAEDKPASDLPPIVSEKAATPKSAKISKAAKDYSRWKEDISLWFENGSELKYHPDYKRWIQSFICGQRTTCGAIPWQDMGIPAYIAAERLSDLSVFYIEGQSSGDESRVLVYMNRSAESRDALLALMEHQYAGGWDFEGSVFYQQKLVTWLERNKRIIISNVMSAESYESSLPVLKWCLELQYLKANILGIKVDTSSPAETAAALLKPFNISTEPKRNTKEWNDLITYVNGQNSRFESALTLLQRASLSTMGSILGTRGSNTESGAEYFHRSEELFTAVTELENCGWDLSSSLSSMDLPKNHMLYDSASLLKDLYPRIRKVVAAETAQISAVSKGIEDYAGKLDLESLTTMFSKIQELLSVFAKNGIIGYSNKYEKFTNTEPLSAANHILSLLTAIHDTQSLNPVQQLTVYSSNALQELSEYLGNLHSIEQAAAKEDGKARNELRSMGVSEIADEQSRLVITKLEGLCDRLEKMEVQNAG